jgi:hypothetical protein
VVATVKTSAEQLALDDILECRKYGIEFGCAYFEPQITASDFAAPEVEFEG